MFATLTNPKLLNLILFSCNFTSDAQQFQ